MNVHRKREQLRAGVLIALLMAVGVEAPAQSGGTVLATGAKVVAVADERSNSLVVSGPEDLMLAVEQLVAEMDMNVSDFTEVRVFPLENADAMELAEIITELYEEAEEASSGSRSSGGRGGAFSGRNQSNSSQRSLEQGAVVAVGDPRTNALLVSAGRESMMQIAELIGRLDASAAKKERVFVYSLEHADVDNVAAILRGMFGDTDTGTRTGQVGSRLVDRASEGATVDINSSFGGLSGGSGSSRR